MLIGMYAVIALAFVGIPKYLLSIIQLISSSSSSTRTKRLPLGLRFGPFKWLNAYPPMSSKQ